MKEFNYFTFPVGKVNILHLYPFSFGEYLDGIGKSMFRELIRDKKIFEKIEKKFHDELIEGLKMKRFNGLLVPAMFINHIELKFLNFL